MAITQIEIEGIVAEAKLKWLEMIEESGKPRTIFVATDRRAALFLAVYEELRIEAAEYGFNVPPIDDGITVNLLGPTNEKTKKLTNKPPKQPIDKMLLRSKQSKQKNLTGLDVFNSVIAKNGGKVG